ncbi:MAG: phage portal protein, partial [Bacilli bacterium]|nr:phage portal protein [Bacilli bacterium]
LYPKQEELIKIERRKVRELKAADYNPKINLRSSGVLEHPGMLKKSKKIRQSWNQVYQGTRNSHKVTILEEGMKYHKIGIAPEDAQFLETRKYKLNEIYRIFRVLPHLVDDLDLSTFSNIEDQSIEFVQHTIWPWLVR